MMKRKIVGASLIAAVLSIPAPVYASHGDPAYYIRYYSNSSYSTQVGEDIGNCSYYGVVYSHSGQTTQYSTQELIGYCANDGQGSYWEPL